MTKYVDNLFLETEACCECGMHFAMTQDFKKRRLDDRKSFYCPKGHSQYYTGKSEAQKLQEKLAQKQRELEAESGRAFALESQRDQLGKSYGKMRDRVKNGVCPCCNRTFQNLQNHMKSEHPEFGSHQVLRSLRDAFGLTQSALANEIGINDSYVSLYENEKRIPGYAESAIDRWVQAN